MRFGITKEIDCEHLGATLAQLGDDAQAIFFKAFIKECSSWGTSLQVEKQLIAINHLLSKEERETLSALSYEEEAS